jgi:hypothetical protein
MSHTYYDLLGVSPLADSADIRRAFRKAVRKYHPDADAVRSLGPEGQARAAAASSQLFEAGRILRDPVLRAAYDDGIGISERRARMPAWRFRLTVRLSGLLRLRPGHLASRIARRRAALGLDIGSRLLDACDLAWDTAYGTRLGQWLLLAAAAVIISGVAEPVRALAGLPQIAMIAAVAVLLSMAGEPTPAEDMRAVLAGAIRWSGSRAASASERSARAVIGAVLDARDRRAAAPVRDTPVIDAEGRETVVFKASRKTTKPPAARR